jgi:phenylpropionate dioxygenase-like ring-hydroxylating dioxygenase large terminal subunit
LYRRELERFSYRSHRCCVGLEAETPNPGDFKRAVVGECSVILVRDAAGGLNVVENVCAHRGMRFCRARHGQRKEFVCPYHQWSYTHQGDLCSARAGAGWARKAPLAQAAGVIARLSVRPMPISAAFSTSNICRLARWSGQAG